MDLYAENILDHFRHPRGKKTVSHPTVTHEEVNASCGDALSVSLHSEGNRIAEFGWQGTGCAISQAAMSMLSEELAGKTAEEILKLTPVEIYALLGVPVGPRRVKCALLCLHALKNALRKETGEAPQGWNETIGK